MASKAGHETIMISWNPPSLFTATPNQIRVLLNGAVVQSLLPSTTFLRLSHLAINTDYHVELVLLSSAGKSSHSLDVWMPPPPPKKKNVKKCTENRLAN